MSATRGSQTFLFQTKKIAMVATACVLLGTTAAPADETYSPIAIVQLPAGSNPLRSTDIAWVDAHSHAYVLADRSNNSVDFINTPSNEKITLLTADPPFAGANKANGGTAWAPNGAGPNGAIIIERNHDVWAADGPLCPPNDANPADCTKSGSLKVIDLKSGKTKNVFYINPTPSVAHPSWPPVTAPATVHGRVDELCYNPASDVVLAGSNSSGFGDSFISFINEDTGEIEEVIRLDGSTFTATDPDLGTPINANSGIEQCQYNPRDGKFYLSIPQLNKGPNGAVLRISGTAPFKVEKVFQITTVGCVQPAGGPAGLTIGPDHQMLVGCNGTSTQSVIIDDRSTLAAAPIVIQFVPTPGGGVDEVWFDPGSNHYYLAQSTPGTMGVEDAGGGTTLPTTDPIATTATGSKNPAADPDRNLVYLPVLANDGTICSTNKDHNGNAGNDKQGCIAIYSAPLDSDDLPVRRRAQK